MGRPGRDPIRALEAAIEAMPPEEAVPVLMYLVRELAGQVDEAVGRWSGPRRLTGTERALFLILYRREGRFVARESLLAALWPDRPEAGGANLLTAYLSRLRTKLRGLIEIDCDPWSGWTLRRMPGVVFPWEDA
ncbi:hypothetical protein DSD19_06205 [Rhodovulum sp. BSW8]|uniref:helix-turn-helix domain-containing protein n=1 Tax=Rhodovulum sp. BSW8 TaxID=2259645 RepID=UPI000DE3D36F|nr:helix-turn-helix domain-containing protein [Rhodovulum sp. BSW8]RBO54052.1 hypothetical protein DSD19_06205 [Rhodovulum sp. BSW8]